MKLIGERIYLSPVSIEDAKSYIIAEDTKVKEGLERLFNKPFEDDILELENVWLRKEIIKKARNME